MGGPTPPASAVAIVTITLDDPVGIRRTVASVAAQDSTSYEHVVVDGGSGPEVTGWLRDWESALPERRRLVTDPPPGIYPSMNTGVRQSSAPLVLILNGGDELLPGAVDRVVAHHAEHRWRWAYGGLAVRDADDRELGSYVFDPFRMTSFRAGWQVVPHPATFVTRDLHDEIGLYREDIGSSADQELLLRAAAASPPANIPGLCSVFGLGGVSGRGGLVAREQAWHRNRCTSGTAFGGTAATDAVVTVGVLGLQLTRQVIAKLRRDPHPWLRRGVAPRPA